MTASPAVQPAGAKSADALSRNGDTWNARLIIACVPQHAATVRKWLDEVLRRILLREGWAADDEDRVFRATLALHELYTNALQHSRSGAFGDTVLITLTVDDALIRVAVEDAGTDADVPTARAGIKLVSWAENATEGRGLAMVGAITNGWAHRPLACGRREVSFRIKRTAA